MEQARKWFSPQSVSGSTLGAILAHGVIYGGLVLLLARNQAPGQAPPSVVEIGYEVLSEPPKPVKEVKPMARSEEPDESQEETDSKPDPAPRELHDAAGVVAGTQSVQKPQPNLGSVSNGTADATPYYKIKPKYPKAALVSGVEGWILMKVDVNESGEVENVRVVDGEQRNMFADEARRAVEKWKYKPFLDASGKPIRKADHQVRVDFKLQDA